MSVGQIIALGGGSIWASDQSAIDDYILAQARCTRPSICFLGTASGDKAENIVKFYDSFSGRNCSPSHLTLFGRTSKRALEELEAQDIIFVGGGNTRSMLATWAAWDIETKLRRALASGSVLCGLSAGAICWFEQGLTDSVAETYGAIEGLGFLRGSVVPHFDTEPERQSAYADHIRQGTLSGGFGVDEYAGLHFIGNALHHAVAETPDSRIVRAGMKNGEVQMEQIPVELIS